MEAVGAFDFGVGGFDQSNKTHILFVCSNGS